MNLSAAGNRRGLKTVAALEGIKGLLVLLAGFGAFALIHRDAQALAESLVRHSHLNPAHHIPRVFLEAAAHLTDARLWMLSAGALAYAGVRLAESWGLWHARAWAEWLGALSGAIYIPFEVISLLARPTALKISALLVNVAVVSFLAILIAGTGRRHP